MRLYDNLDSGNGYKARLILRLTGRPFERIELDTDAGETRTPDYLAKNPNGRIPLLELDDGRLLPESDAILYYVAQGTPFWPDDAFAQAQCLQWLFFEQYNHEPTIAVSRYIHRHLPVDHPRRAELPALRVKGDAALGVMETHLKSRDWFVGDRATIADLALYAYTHVADQGGFDLAPFPAVRAWLDRVAALPGMTPITAG